MTTTTDIKFEFYIDGTSDQDTSTSLSPADATDLGLNAGVVVDKLGGGITFNNAGSIKGGKTDWDVGVGFWLGYQDEDYKVAIGDPAEEKITWDGSDLVLDIDASHLTINGGTTGQILTVGNNGLVTFTTPTVPPLADLEDLGNVSSTAPTSNQVLAWTGTEWAPQNASSSFSLAFEDLSNAIGGTPQINDIWVKTSASGFSPTAFALQNLVNVTMTSLANDDVLVYDSANSHWANKSASSFGSSLQQALGDHTDVNLAGGAAPTNSQVLYYLSSLGEWRAGQYGFSVADVTGGNKRVNLLAPNSVVIDNFDLEGLDGITLGRSGDTLQIENTAHAFKTIAVAGQTSVVADGIEDTLTLIAGANMTLTTNATGDSISFAAIPTNMVLNDLTNVTTVPANGEVLWYNSSTSQWNDGQYTLGLVDITNSDNKSLRLYDPRPFSANNQKVDFEGGTGITLGRSGDTLQIENSAEAFKTIAVAGQTSVVADGVDDTLTLVAGTNMTLTTNATGDSITFSSGGSGGSLALNDLTNVTTAPGNGDVLWYSAGNSRWEEGGYELSVADASTGNNKEIRLVKPSGSYSGSTGLITLDPGAGIALGRSGQTIQISSLAATEAFKTVAVSGQTPLTADSATDTLTFVAGTGITLTTSSTNDSLTISSSSSGPTEAFKTVAVSGQSNVVADSATDTLTFAAGSGISLTTNASTDTITIASSGSGGAASGLQDADGDTKIQVEEASDEDKIRFDTAGSERMIIDNAGGISIGSSSNHSGSRVVINDIRQHGTGSAGPPTGFGAPMLQVGQETFRAGGVYSIGMGYTSSGYANPPVEIAAKTLSSSGGTTADIIFGTRGSISGPITERIRILTSGGITFDGETTSAHALDDYEEGTYQVQFRSGSATSSTYVTAGTSGTGSYTKIGDIVHVSVPCQNINPSGLTSTGDLFISLPFIVDITYLQFPCAAVNFVTRAAGSMLGTYAVAQPGSAAATIVQRNSTNSTESTLTVGDVLRTTQASGAYTGIRFSVTYKTA